MRTAFHKVALGTLIVVTFAVAGCGPESKSPTSEVPTAAPSKDEATAKAKATASVGEGLQIPAGKGAIAGRVIFEGEPPKVRTINFGAEVQCAKIHKTPPVYEAVVVNPNGTLKWTLVALKGKVPGDYEVPSEPVVMDQVGCVFTPHVVALMAGQEVEFRNSDTVTHNVRANPKLNLPFNWNFPPNGSDRVAIASREIGIPVKCDIHFWMSGYIHALPHPFFALTGDDGTFTINGIPPGTYSLRAWHETLDSQTQEVTVEPDNLTKIDFTFSEQ